MKKYKVTVIGFNENIILLIEAKNFWYPEKGRIDFVIDDTNNPKASFPSERTIIELQ